MPEFDIFFPKKYSRTMDLNLFFHGMNFLKKKITPPLNLINKPGSTKK